jgi:hypothetical protein
MVASAHGAILVNYQFGVPGQETTVETSPVFGPTSVLANLTATPVTDPMGTIGIEISSAATTPPGAPFLRVDPQGNSASAAIALTNNKYFEFTITPNAGFLLDLTSLTFDAARGGGGTPRGYVVRSSLNSFATDLATADLLTVRPTYTPVSIDLSGFADAAGAVTFRVYSYSPGAGSSVDYDNITVNGSVVPEPATGLLGVSGIVLLTVRRRSR